MLDPQTIFVGNSAAWYAGRDADNNGVLDDLSTGYTCRLRVIGTSIDRAVTTLVADDAGNNNRRFLAALTPTDTTTIGAGVFTVIIDIANASQNWSKTEQGSLTISAVPQETGTELERLNKLKEALEDALLAAVGGSVQQVWNGRFGNRMTYNTMSYAQIQAALEETKRMIADEERIASGGSKRSGVRIALLH